MKHKVADLKGGLLDAATAKAAGGELVFGPKHGWRVKLLDRMPGYHDLLPFSTDWNWGGPIIERERISLNAPGEDGGPWRAYATNTGIRREIERLTMQEGPTSLIAAMRAYVASKFGDEVELP